MGDRIREHRIRAGLSQDALAELVGVSRQAVTKWESGASSPTAANLFKLAEIFGTTADLLIDKEKAETEENKISDGKKDKKRRQKNVPLRYGSRPHSGGIYRCIFSSSVLHSRLFGKQPAVGNHSPESFTLSLVMAADKQTVLVHHGCLGFLCSLWKNSFFGGRHRHVFPCRGFW